MKIFETVLIEELATVLSDIRTFHEKKFFNMTESEALNHIEAIVEEALSYIPEKYKGDVNTELEDEDE